MHSHGSVGTNSDGFINKNGEQQTSRGFHMDRFDLVICRIYGPFSAGEIQGILSFIGESFNFDAVVGVSRSEHQQLVINLLVLPVFS